MDWDRAIERNSEALKVIVAGLFAMLGLASGTTVARLPRPLHASEDAGYLIDVDAITAI
jgi:hypothetical protein